MSDTPRYTKPTDALGATGQFPKGKMMEEDEGEIRFRIGHTNTKIIIDFGQPVAWLGMDAKEARELANILYDHARAIE